jgi:hypothetical protein
MQVINTVLLMEQQAADLRWQAYSVNKLAAKTSSDDAMPANVGGASSIAASAASASHALSSALPSLHADGVHGASSCVPRIFIWDSLFLAKLLRWGVWPCSSAVTCLHSPSPDRSGGRNGQLVYDYALVRRWAMKRSLDVHSVDWIIVPIHLGDHWALGMLDMRKRTGEERRWNGRGILR